jgi:ADP-heptose:LPS heptosyltransferase
MNADVKFAVVGEKPSILVVRRDNIGDLVCTLPLISALRRRYPTAYLAALVNSYNAPVLAGNPELDDVFLYGKSKHLKPGSSLFGNWLARFKMIWELRRQSFDLVVLASPAPTKHWFRAAKLVGAKDVLAIEAGGQPLPGFITLPVRPPIGFGQLHAVEQNLVLLSGLAIATQAGELRIYPDPKILVDVKNSIVRQFGDERKQVIGLHISARKVSQRWDALKFVELIRQMYAQRDCRFVLFWSPGPANDPKHPGDDDKAAMIMNAVSGIPLLPMATRTLPELIAGLAVIDQMICSDGGAMHLAAALGKPMVCLFGDSDARVWHPWGVPYRIIQPDSRDVCEVLPEDVLRAFDELECVR